MEMWAVDFSTSTAVGKIEWLYTYDARNAFEIRLKVLPMSM